MEQYKEKLEEAKKLYESANDDQKHVLESLFPELKESEDEKIRMSLIELFKDMEWDDSILHDYNMDKDKTIAWLEKQGTPSKLSEEEQNRFAKGVLTSCAMSFINYLDAHKHEGKMCVSNGECEDIENAFQNAMWDRLHRYYCKYIEKQGEQKPAWSEEDEQIILSIEQVMNCASLLNIVPEKMDKIRTWLKSLKQRIGGESYER